jgi:RNA polymerase sigma-70 factor (ECF subfamily)
MPGPPTTRPSLLVRIRDARDAEAWGQFVRLYAPVVYGFGRRKGLQDADAGDLTQEVLRAVSAAAARLQYDPGRGTFRGWLFTVARRKLCDLRARQQRPGQGSGDSGTEALLEARAAPEDEALWDQDYRRHLFRCAAEQVRGCFTETTWQAFWETAALGRGGKEVAAGLGLSVAAVYLAKGRVMARLKEQIRRWEAE